MAQKHRWKKITAALTFLHEHNTGVCLETGISLGELINHYIIGLDKTCLMADASGDLKIFGEVERKMHEKKVEESIDLTTMVRSGSSFGSNGKTEFIIKGKKSRNGYDEMFFEKYGAAPGFKISMAENAFMTEKAWAGISEKVGMCLCCSLFTFL